MIVKLHKPTHQWFYLCTNLHTYATHIRIGNCVYPYINPTHLIKGCINRVILSHFVRYSHLHQTAISPKNHSYIHERFHFKNVIYMNVHIFGAFVTVYMLCEYYYYYYSPRKKKEFSFIFHPPTQTHFDLVYTDDCKHSRSKKNLLILVYIPAPHHVLCRVYISVLDIILMRCKAK